jgi:hypothetical protein
MRPETESLERQGESLAKAMRCNARVAFCLVLSDRRVRPPQEELASGVLMLERRRPQDQRSRERVSLPRSSPKAASCRHTPLGDWLVIITSIVSGLSKVGPP